MSEPAATLTVRRVFRLPAERVFDAWTDSSLASRWLFRTPDGQIVKCEIDGRQGGTFTITDRRAGEDVEHSGSYVEFDRPRRLVFTFSVPKYSDALTTVVLAIAPSSEGCELTLENRDVPAEWAASTEEGWCELLARMEAILGGESSF
ncbi:MAG: SRPBCC domain-containing protein [Vicinamibacterales bacterium]